MAFTLDDLKDVNWKDVKDVTETVKQAVQGFLAILKLLPKHQNPEKNDYTPKKGDLVNTILLVGMEGTGKTELIKRCFGHIHADSTRETEEFKVYTSVKNVDDKKHWLNIADYMGQNIGSLVASFIDAQRQTSSPMRYEHIHSLIVMVDLIPPEEDRSISAPRAPIADSVRVKTNIEQWNEMAIDAIFGLLTDPPLQYVCVFINKYDLITDPKKYSKAKAEKNYLELTEYLKLKVKPIKAGGKIKVEVITGSAKYGDGQVELLASLTRHSVAALPKKKG